MNPEHINIQPLQHTDIERLSNLQPPNWNDIRNVFRKFYGFNYFFPYKGLFNDRIISVGELILTKSHAWLGNIIVDPEFRNSGLGRQMTIFLSDLAAEKGYTNQILLATEIGRPLYSKCGFETVGEYSFLNSPRPMTVVYDPNIRRIQNGEFTTVSDLDRKASGEDRTEILAGFLNNCFVHTSKSGEVNGFFIDDLGDGLIVADNDEAGLKLMKFRLSRGRNFITIPADHVSALNAASNWGYKKYRKAYHMIKGNMKKWEPKMIYNRIGGYLG